jgi:hypothetical protein
MFDASCTGERVTATRGEFINNRNFALVATGVATANDMQGVDFALMSKLLILLDECGGRTRTRTLDPLIKSQRLKCPGLAQTSNNIIQKELAFLRNRSSTAFNSGR